MTQTNAPTIPLTAKPAAAPQKPQPSRTPYRPVPGTSFTGALQAAVNEARTTQLAMLANSGVANPSAARIAAPTADGSNAPLVDAMSPPPGVDARLWESLVRGTPLTGLPVAATAGQPTQVVAMSATQPAEPAVQAVTPAMRAEQAQAFLRSIKGSDQTKADEYENAAQARAWGYSTCSAASLTAVLRAAGQDVKIADVMREMPGGMTIKLGLVSRPSLVNAANHFGAKATDDVTSYESLKAATDSGQPVLVDIRNGKFPEGHWIVVTGVDESGIRCADSSRYDLTTIPKGEFMRSWSSRGIRLEGLTPKPTQTISTTPKPSVRG
ncbi:MAG: C39 family peptidase [Chloroflexi bacterium]|nr:C39 family peptidase [Chloroflexota bacterium]